MPEREHAARTVVVTYECVCGGEMTGDESWVQMSNPPKYSHKCPKCRRVEFLPVIYPTFKMIRLDD